jgi:hypothetical protein
MSRDYNNPTLTCNRLMLLLALYRGSPIALAAVGTYDADVMWFLRMGLITADPRGPSGWGLTPKGDQLVRGILDGGNRLLGITVTTTATKKGD